MLSRSQLLSQNAVQTSQAVPIDTRTEAKVKVAINGFGRIGALQNTTYIDVLESVLETIST